MEINKTLEFVDIKVRLGEEVLELAWKPTWKKVKAELKTVVEKKWKKTYEQKESDIYRGLAEDGRCRVCGDFRETETVANSE